MLGNWIRPDPTPPTTQKKAVKDHPQLDRPVWASLSTSQRSLAAGDALALRYRRDVNLFASAADDSETALAALVELVAPGEAIYVLQAPAITKPSALTLDQAAEGVQMVATQRIGADINDADIDPLADADAVEMQALAGLTNPGPFLEKTHTMGAFRGVRIDGRLAAMAGERMRFPGFTEISGVCTHPDFRGRGLARRLSAAVAAGIETRGDTPFLHAWKTNDAAIGLYHSLGFRHRCDVNVAVLSQPPT